MKKLLAFMLAIALIACLFVSCNSNKVEDGAVATKGLVYATFEKGHTKALDWSYSDYNEDLYWYYTAEKKDGFGKTGQTPEGFMINVAGDNGKGLAGNVGPFSEGDWYFTLRAYKSPLTADGTKFTQNIDGESVSVDKYAVTDTDLVYKGNSPTVNIKKGQTNYIPVNIDPVGDTGTIEFNDAYYAWQNESAYTGNLYLTASYKCGGEPGSFVTKELTKDTDGHYNIEGKLEISGEPDTDEIPVGFYEITFKVQDKETSPTNLFAEQTLDVLVMAGLPTVISGDLIEGLSTNNQFKEVNALCFKAEEASSTVKLTKCGNPNEISLQYYETAGTDGWKDYTIDKTITLSNKGDKVYFKASSSNEEFSSSWGSYYYFDMDGKIAASGNIMSLVDSSCQSTTIPCEYCFVYLFDGCTALTSVSERLLPAETLASDCYSGMFWGCTGLTSLPEGLLPAETLASDCYYEMFMGCTGLTSLPEGLLPAETLADYCYSNMFQDCSKLKNAPKLPATKLNASCYSDMFTNCASLTDLPVELLSSATDLAESCYNSMFYGCTSLETAPELPATKLAGRCYTCMFQGCTSLKTAPELPATTLADADHDYGCYEKMFSGCTSLTKAPVLPAETLTEFCYNSMFEGCSNLTQITMLATDTSASGCLNYWVYNVAVAGNFYKAPSMTTLPSGASGIPSSWHVSDVINTVGDLMALNPDFPKTDENGWINGETGKEGLKMFCTDSDLKIGSQQGGTTDIGLNTKVSKTDTGYTLTNGDQATTSVTFVVENKKITSITVGGTNTSINGTYVPAPIPMRRVYIGSMQDYAPIVDYPATNLKVHYKGEVIEGLADLTATGKTADYDISSLFSNCQGQTSFDVYYADIPEAATQYYTEVVKSGDESNGSDYKLNTSDSTGKILLVWDQVGGHVNYHFDYTPAD